MRKGRKRKSGYRKTNRVQDHPFKQDTRESEGGTVADKSYAKRMVREAIRRGEVIKPLACQRCQKGVPQVFHINGYEDWRDFVFWCSKCQTEYHQMRESVKKQGLSPDGTLEQILKDLIKQEISREGTRRELVRRGDWTEDQAAEDREHWASVITQARQHAVAQYGVEAGPWTLAEVTCSACQGLVEDTLIEGTDGQKYCMPCAMLMDEDTILDEDAVEDKESTSPFDLL